jgi:hypothetical protein
MVDQPPWLVVELPKARPSARSRPRWLAARWGKEGGRHRESILASTKGWKAARRWHTSGGTLARKGNSVGAVRARRRRVGGVGIFTEGGAAFYRAEARWERLGAFSVRR